jgi:inosine triphosphate pyrophosphatase
MSFINIVTSNEDKFNEITHIMKEKLSGIFDIGFRKIDYLDNEIKEIQGESVDIVQWKCKDAVNIINDITIVEDTSFSIDCLNGLPGAYIRDFFLKLGNNGVYRVCEAFGVVDKPHATEECYIAICKGIDSEIFSFKGEIRGHIVQPQNNVKDEFNWNYFFRPEGAERVYGFMTLEEKCQFSARKVAIEKLCDFIIETKYLN